ncbi:hypothetical protein Tco_0721747 [Tanacetum coccineum]
MLKCLKLRLIFFLTFRHPILNNWGSIFFPSSLRSFTYSKQDEQQFKSLDTLEFVEELGLVEEKAIRAKLVGPSSACPSGRLPVPAVLIPGCLALPCKVSSLLAVETFHLGLVKPNYFFVGHVQLPSSILQESSCSHSQHSNVPPQVHLF